MRMRITRTTLDAIKDRDEFRDTFADYAEGVLGSVRFFPILSKPRIYEAHGAWINDLKRVQDREQHLIDGLDHFKQCGHLAFWLRRTTPVAELQDLDFGSSELPLRPREKELRGILLGYHNEYLAFDLGYQLCKYYEVKHLDKPSERARDLVLSPDYYQTVCHFMKYKNVSPHALHLIYKSIFYYNGMDAPTLSIADLIP
jgi:hypothetical protein